MKNSLVGKDHLILMFVGMIQMDQMLLMMMMMMVELMGLLLAKWKVVF